jgi:methionyl aminopeptidase
VPSDRKLKEKDIVSLDLGILYKGFHADMAVTVPVSDKVDLEALRLIRVTKKALKRGIRKIHSGITLGDVGNTIQRYVESQGYNVVRELCGHGIGKKVHEEPSILNYGKRKTGLKLEQGMVICLEPMVTAGDWKIKKSKDRHGYITEDNSLSAHFEHTMAVTKSGCQVLTE